MIVTTRLDSDRGEFTVWVGNVEYMSISTSQESAMQVKVVDGKEGELDVVSVLLSSDTLNPVQIKIPINQQQQ